MLHSEILAFFSPRQWVIFTDKFYLLVTTWSASPTQKKMIKHGVYFYLYINLHIIHLKFGGKTPQHFLPPPHPSFCLQSTSDILYSPSSLRCPSFPHSFPLLSFLLCSLSLSLSSLECKFFEGRAFVLFMVQIPRTKLNACHIPDTQKMLNKQVVDWTVDFSFFFSGAYHSLSCYSVFSLAS